LVARMWTTSVPSSSGPDRARCRSVVELNTGANIYPRLSGRFSTPVAAGAVVRIPVTVTGAVAGVTSAISSLTPWRRWPE
ncbi:hypothetical protein, partial [Amycolatopsis sp. NPDC051716]|uniref:hypothetical protein n=1 Tax=Amycolatopsis sp. NPDC051716 TaxID=3155804 RepID=UPI00343F22C7